MKANTMPLSVYSVPLIGLIGLLVCLWHPQTDLQANAPGQDTVFLVQPDPRLDKSMTVFLRQEAKNVAYSRQCRSAGDLAHTISNYNLIAQECTPAVFKKTHLPPAIAF